jgi:hypothetical protein
MADSKDPPGAPAQSAPEDWPFTITLPCSAWLTVAQILGRAPFCEVAGILDVMSAQVEPQRRAHEAAAQPQSEHAAQSAAEASSSSTTH